MNPIEFPHYKQPRGTIPANVEVELLFLFSGPCVLILYICIKFQENIFNSLNFIEQT